MRLDIKDLKKLLSKISIAVEKSKINPKSGWIEIETIDNKLVFKISNYDYYLSASINCTDLDSDFHITLLAETFIPLISKLDCDFIDLEEKLNNLIIKTDQSSYTFPLIKELGKTKELDEIDFNDYSNYVNFSGKDLSSVANINSKGLISAIFVKDIQQYIYLDNFGAITFTENIYVNNFKEYNENDEITFKALLTSTQSKLLDIFSDIDNVYVYSEHTQTFNKSPTYTNKLCFMCDNIKLIIVAQPMDITDEFPCMRLRNTAIRNNLHTITIDRKQVDKALSRLMVFDKSFDSTIMDYSKLVFKEDHLELVSIKNKNIENINYINSNNFIEHESMIRFADLIKQLKSIKDNELVIGYGEMPAIVIDSQVKLLIPEIKLISRV